MVMRALVLVFSTISTTEASFFMNVYPASTCTVVLLCFHAFSQPKGRAAADPATQLKTGWLLAGLMFPSSKTRF